MVGVDVDVVVLGSGIGGSTVAAILAKQGVRVALVDAAVHPRFALGESTIGETSFLLRQMAARWGVPELGLVSTNRGLGRTSAAVTASNAISASSISARASSTNPTR